MKLIWNTVAILITLAITSAESFALDSIPEKIRSIRTNSWGMVLDLNSNVNGCGGRNIKFNVSDPQSDKILSLALAAQMAGKEVKARYVECSQSPWPNTATATDLTVYTD